MLAKRLQSLAAASIAAALFSPGAFGYAYTGTRWASNSITMHLQLGASNGPLLDGHASWGASAEDALNLWSAQIATSKFAIVRDSTATQAARNRVNNVFFSNSIYGEAWGSGVLAVTLTYSNSAGQSTECDVIFNSTIGWDSYRGSLRYSSSGAVYDFHRVALHEFGHVLGLDHPDQAGQSVAAVMNSRITNLDALTNDDIAGAQSLYGASIGAATAPVITTQPSSRTAIMGSNVSFTVAATSSGAMTYQWWKNGAIVPGGAGATLTLTNVTSAASGSYYAVVTNSIGSTTSLAATLTVLEPVVAPTIVASPSSQTAALGAPVTFSVSASGTGPLTYAWRKNGVAIPGANAATLTLPSVQAADAGNYSVVVTNSAGSATSAVATLTLSAAPAVVSGPVSQTIAAGQRLTLSVGFAGAQTTFQWLKNGVPIPGANRSEFTVEAVGPADAGDYAVTLTNGSGSVTSAPATVTVAYSQLVNLSSRGLVRAGEALAAGFVLRGDAEKTLLVRGIGPALTDFGISGALSRPKLEVVAQQSGQALAANGAWDERSQLSSTFAALGAFALRGGSGDSASEVRLASGLFTMRVTSEQAGAGGIALAELYDANAADYRCRLVNISTLGYSAPGDDTLVSGFTIQGNLPKRVLIRGVGPTLASHRINGAMADPRIDVYRSGETTPLAGNNDWGGSVELKTAFARSGAFELPDGSRDAALLLSLAPGSYTVVLSDAAGRAGQVLLEVYDLD